jgi:hypothetical protein
MAHLDVYSELKEEFNITEDMELDSEFRKVFVQNQVEEIRKILWREVVDYIIADHMAKSDDESVSVAGNTKKTEKRSNIKQFARALKAYNELIAELEA